MEEENVLQLIINSENLPIIIDSGLGKWSFDSYSRGYHEYMNIWVLLIGNESLICRKEKENTYDPLAVAITRGNVVVRHVPQNICCFFLKFFISA